MKAAYLLKILHNLEQLRQRERWPRSRLEAFQMESLRRMREYAYGRSPFYQRFHHGLFGRPLAELPVLTKAMLMKHFDDLVTDRSIRLDAVREFAATQAVNRLFLDRYWVTATSGSSGHPGFFLFDEPEWLTMVASFARGQEWSGERVNPLRRRKMVTIASISPWHTSSQVAVTAQSWLRPSIRIAASESLEAIVQQLNDYQPDLLVAYASMSRILAEEQLAERLHIQPDKTFAASEVLTDETRRRVKMAWGNEPFNQYVATETAGIASEHEKCRHMHLFEDLVMVEVVDEGYRPVRPGTYGAKLLVTTLFGRTQPLIRYELNDSVRLGTEACSSGLSFGILESVQGRVEDALQLPAKSGGRVAIQPLVFNRVMDILPVSGWQIVQGADDGLTLMLSGAREEVVDAKLADMLMRSLISEGATVPSIQVQRVSAIPKTSSGKAPLVKAYRP